jgi:hypothetical protein
MPNIALGFFSADTPVLFADGVARPILQARMGDQLLSYDFGMKCFRHTTVITGKMELRADIYLVEAPAAKIALYTNSTQQWYTQRNWRQTQWLLDGDRAYNIQDRSLTDISVFHREIHGPPMYMWSLFCMPLNEFFVGQLLVKGSLLT